MRDRLHVLIVTPWYPSAYRPQNGVLCREQARMLAERADVDLIFIESVSPKHLLSLLFGPKARDEEEDGVRIHHRRILSLERVSPGAAAFLNARAAARAYRRVVKLSGRPDVIHGHVTFPGGYAACRLGAREHLPVVVTEHASFFDLFMRNKRRYMLYALGRADCYTAVGSVLAAKVSRYTRRPCLTLPNFIDTVRFRGAARPAFSPEGPFVLISIALMKPVKRLDLLLSAVAILRGQGQDVRALLLGDGVTRPALEKQATDLGIAGAVTFTGLQDNQQLPAYFARAHLLVIASDVETFGITGVEAMAAGVPVLSTACGGPEDYVTPETGLIVAAGSAEALAEGILQMRDKYLSYPPETLRDYAAAHFGKEAVVHKLMDIYSACMAKNQEE